MWRAAFNPENSFWRFLGKMVDVVGLSLCWVFCSIPIFTVGASSVALYDAVYHCLRKEDDSTTYKRFFSTFKENFKAATLITLPGLLVAALFSYLTWVAAQGEAQGLFQAGMLGYAYRAFFLVPLGVWLLAYGVLSRFDQGPWQALGNAFRLTFAHLPSVLLAALVAGVAGWLCWYIWPGVLAAPCLVTWFNSPLFERIFKPFLKSEDEAEE